VALARAIVIRPDVLLLDEPLSNLDARLRLSMRNEIRRIHAQTRITTFYVTHDQSEALSMADHIAILNQGKVEQIGPPSDAVLQTEQSLCADFMARLLINAVVEEPATDGVVCVRSGEFLCEVASTQSWLKGTEVRIGFRPESVSFSHGAAENSFPATILETLYLGAQQETLLKTGFLGDQSIRALEINPGKSNSANKLKTVSIDAEQILIFEKSSN
jgi:ABC-type sugar transport system ATPase subunit